jgi:DNA gyrase subunit A
MGVKGVTLEGPEDEVIGMVCVRGLDSDILVVSENGYGKRSAVEDYRITNRGGKGVKTLSVTEKTGSLISILNVTDDDDLMIINRSGITIRTGVEDLRVMGRATQGVKLISLRGDDRIASVCRVPKGDDEDVVAEGEEPTTDSDTSTESAE